MTEAGLETATASTFAVATTTSGSDTNTPPVQKDTTSNAGTDRVNMEEKSRKQADAEEEEEEQQQAEPDELQTSSGRHWRKIRSAVAALAAFRSRRVKATDFERIRMCGEGGSGLVYLVRLKNSSMYFALKVQRKQDLQAKERRIRRALIEREVLITCAHPFVCSLYTAFQDTRHLYLLMDYCAGGDLASLIRDVVRRPLEEEEARFYVSEIVAALEWIHLHGYVYRDLKPENVLIHESGHIRLGDFGTAERGSVQFGGKVCRKEVDSAIDAKDKSQSQAESQTQPVGAGHSSETVAAAAAAAQAAVGKYVARGTGRNAPGTPAGASISYSQVDDEDEEDDAVTGLTDADLNSKLHSIVVEADLLLEDTSAASTKPLSLMKNAPPPSSSKHADSRLIQSAASGGKANTAFSYNKPPQVAATTTTTAPAAKLGSAVVPTAAAAAEPAENAPEYAPSAGALPVPGDLSGAARYAGDSTGVATVESASETAQLATGVGCGFCGKGKGKGKNGRRALFSSSGREGGKGTSKSTKARMSGVSEQQALFFSRGRGSVKLNVLLDSQTFIGTADFMAPEMVTGKERQGTAMDWWALGVMLYEMTLGSLPFNGRLGDNDDSVFRSIVTAKLAFPPYHRLSPATVDLIEQLLRKEPSERLGQRKGVGEIKRHRFFESVHWALIANRKAPFSVFGPDDPGWAEAMMNSRQGARRNCKKMATWTWQAAADGQRPDVPPAYKHNGEKAGELLSGRDSLSVSHCKVDPKTLARLGHDLGIGITPSPAAADDDDRLPEAGHAVGIKETLSAGVAALNSVTDDTAVSTRRRRRPEGEEQQGGQGEHSRDDARGTQDSSSRVQGTGSGGRGAVAGIAGAGTTGVDLIDTNLGAWYVEERTARGQNAGLGGAGEVAGGANGSAGTSSSSGVAAGNGEGGGIGDVAKNLEGNEVTAGNNVAGEEEKEERKTPDGRFEGYDFNTLRKVGSFMARGGGGNRTAPPVTSLAT